MFLGEVLSSGSIPVLETMLRFAGQRQQLINHNIANLSTPDFRPVDADPAGFQKLLSSAISERRARTGGMHGELELRGSREVGVGADGGLMLMPRTFSGNVLRHDRNNGDLDRVMQANAENAAVYRVTSELLRGRYQQIKDAIAERV